MRKVILHALPVFVALVIAVGVFSMAFHEPSRVDGTSIQPDSSVMPGRGRPGIGLCQHDHYQQSFFCWYERDRQTIYYSMDEAGQIVSTTVTVMGLNITAADMILLWGDPTWAQYQPGSVTIGWDKASAWIITRNFTMESRIALVTYYRDIQARGREEAWRGFKIQPDFDR